MPCVSPGRRLFSAAVAVSTVLAMRSPISRSTDAPGIVYTVTSITGMESPTGPQHFDTWLRFVSSPTRSSTGCTSSIGD
jgi:hypothetical protein